MTLSLPMLQAMFAQQTAEIPVACLQIEHDDLAEPLRFVNDKVDLVRGADTYLAFPFRFNFPDDADESPRVQLVVDDVDRQMVLAIRSLSSSPTITLDVVLKSSPTTVEAGPWLFVMRQALYDAQTVTIELGYEYDTFDLPANKWVLTPSLAPGVF